MEKEKKDKHAKHKLPQISRVVKEELVCIDYFLLEKWTNATFCLVQLHEACIWYELNILKFWSLLLKMEKNYIRQSTKAHLTTEAMLLRIQGSTFSDLFKLFDNR